MKSVYCYFKKVNIVKVAYYFWLVFLFWFFFNLFFPYKVVTFSKFETTKPVYAKGEPICVAMEFEKHRDFQGDLKWLLIDGVAFELPAGVINRGIGAGTFTRCFIVDVASSEYHIRLEAEYKILHDLRRILVEKETNQFFIQ